MIALTSWMESSLHAFAKLTYQPYHLALQKRLDKQGELTICVVGANDGKINDPVYGFAMHHRDQTRMILIEPQADLQEPLKRNYKSHPNVQFIEGAVGGEDQLSLYTVHPKYWPQTQPFYAKAWPNYRAPSGMASMDRARVADWLERFVSAPTDGVVETRIQVKPLVEWLQTNQVDSGIDVLQVDTEGVDDEVIYHSNLEITQPHIIYFESKNLARPRLKKLRNYLSGLGYQCRQILGNILAQRV